MHRLDQIQRQKSGHVRLLGDDGKREAPPAVASMWFSLMVTASVGPLLESEPGLWFL